MNINNNFLNFYYKSLEKKSSKELFSILFFKNTKYDLNKYFKDNFKSKAEYFFLSARSSLYFFLKNYEVQNKSIKGIVVTSFTCDSVINSIINAGYNPILADIEKENYSIDLNDLKKIDVNKYSIILIQHTFGIPAKYLNEIIKFAKYHNKIVIEDCSLSFFSKINNNSLGSFGDASIFSFELSKSITTQRGGCLIINNKNLDLKKINESYLNIPYPSTLDNYKKNIQIIISNYMYNSKFYNLWLYVLKILYNLNIFEKSTPRIENKGKINYSNYIQKMDINYKNLLSIQIKDKLTLINKNKSNFNYLMSKLTNQRLINRMKYLSNFNYLIRLPLEIKNKDLFIKKINKVSKIELGYWFKNLAEDPKYFIFKNLKSENKNCNSSKKIANQIINIPLSFNPKFHNHYNDIVRILNNE